MFRIIFILTIFISLPNFTIARDLGLYPNKAIGKIPPEYEILYDTFCDYFANIYDNQTPFITKLKDSNLWLLELSAYTKKDIIENHNQKDAPAMITFKDYDNWPQFSDEYVKKLSKICEPISKKNKVLELLVFKKKCSYKIKDSLIKKISLTKEMKEVVNTIENFKGKKTKKRCIKAVKHILAINSIQSDPSEILTPKEHSLNDQIRETTSHKKIINKPKSTAPAKTEVKNK